ncbi:MAG TPA: hypothetical protein VNA89_15920, partial [Gemmatimonadaceae bacterium]|nr:hypothetical protein [Gemmatimonadaceae bacterium]
MNVKSGLWLSATPSGPACALRLETYKERDDQDQEREVAIVSGELQKGEKVHWFLSHQRAASREPVRFDGTRSHLDADVRFGPRNFITGQWGTLSVDFTAAERATLRLTGPAGVNETIPLRWKQKEFRDLVIELDKLATATFPQRITWRDIQRDLGRVFRAAGFKPRIIRSNRSLADDPGGWTAGELHDALTTYRRGERAPWYVHVFLTSKFEEEEAEDDAETLGIMFDTDIVEGNVNGIAREGCAVFVDAHRLVYAPEDVDREILMTLVHEIGHSLNLLHSFESEKGRPDSPSIMNYPEAYDYGEDQYYQDFDFTFDRSELTHLHHHSAVVTEPGRADGEEFGRDIFREAPRRLPVSVRNEGAVRRGRFASDFTEALKAVEREVQQDLRVALTLPKTRVLPSEPLVATLAVTNGGADAFTLRSSLDWAAGDLHLEMRRGREGPYTTLHPPVRRCTHPKPTTLAPGETVAVQVPLILTREGDPLAAPGVYEIRAALQLRRERKWVRLVSRPAALVVARPSTPDERRLGRLYRTRHLKAYLLLPGADLDPKAREAAARLHEIAPEQHAGRIATLALAREATSRSAAKRPIPEAFRDPAYVRQAVAAVAAGPSGTPEMLGAREGSGEAGLSRMARGVERLLDRRADRLEALARTTPARAGAAEPSSNGARGGARGGGA